MPQVKILHLITQLELGGAQQTTLEVLRRLNRTRFAPTLLSSPGGALAGDARAIPALSVHALPSLVRPVRPWYDVHAFNQLVRFIAAGNFFIVHTHSSKAGILGRWAAHRAGVKAICHTVHGFPFHAYQPWWVRRAYQAVERQTGQITARLIVVNPFDASQGLQAGIGWPSQYCPVPYGIDLNQFHRNGLSVQSARERLGLDPKTPTIGTVACFKPQKSPADFLQLCSRLKTQLPQLQCIMVGDGSMRPMIERLRRKLGLENTVHLLGWRRDIPEILTALDVFVLTSRWEGLPVAVLEAQAMEVPVVATDTGGIRDCITHQADGWLVPVGDGETLANTVLEVMRNRAAAQHVTERAAKRVRSHSTIDQMVARLEALYEELLKEREGRFG